MTKAPEKGRNLAKDDVHAAIARLLPAAREKGVPVVYTTSPFCDNPAPKSAADFSPGFRRWDRRGGPPT